jgi:hypothetical protein
VGAACSRGAPSPLIVDTPLAGNAEAFTALVGPYLRRFFAVRLDVPVVSVASWSFKAEPGREYSTYTVEDFSCCVTVSLAGGETRYVYLDQHDVVELLNEMPTP